MAIKSPNKCVEELPDFHARMARNAWMTHQIIAILPEAGRIAAVSA